MTDLSVFDLDDLADILQDQGAHEYGMHHYVHRVTGEVLLDGDGDGVDLERALDGRGAFRRFRDQTMGRHPELETPWHQFRTVRAHRRAAQWLADVDVVDQEQVDAYAADHPDPVVP